MNMKRAESSGEVCKMVYNCLKMRKGSFLYDKSLGSMLHTLDLSKGNYKERARMLAEEALAYMPMLRLANADVAIRETGYNLSVTFEYKGRINTVEVRING